MEFFQHIRWRPEIGDPTFMGWFTVFAYAMAAFAALIAAVKAGSAPRAAGASRATWKAIAVLMLLLCVNKQLDLQSLFTDIGRVFAWKYGWYEKRREFQKWFVIGVLVISVATTVLMTVRFRDFWKKSPLLGAGLAFLLTFIVVRAISFHHVDVFLKHAVAGVRMNWFLELTGIAMVSLAALLDYRNARIA
ncbi:MAG: hypothetical protein RL088_298 [Verrucomicrobiota bacterium]|jgi:hypothetical protein